MFHRALSALGSSLLPAMNRSSAEREGAVQRPFLGPVACPATPSLT